MTGTPQSLLKDLFSSPLRCSFQGSLTQSIIKSFAHLVWPEVCPVCGRTASPCCENCLRSAVSPLPAFCLKCGGPYGADCCSPSVPCYALSLHEGISRDILIDMKYRNVRSLGIRMGRLMGETFSSGSSRADLLVPVPLHLSGIREYNQAELLAEGISEVWKKEASDSILVWRSDLMPQVGKGGLSRHMMPKDAMSVKADLTGINIVLVDDVYTTGNTLRTALSAVESAGGTVSSVLLWSRRIPSAENEISWSDTGI